MDNPKDKSVQRLFPIDLPYLQFAEFPAKGFNEPACGVVYGRKNRPQQGMPLGALDTGRLGIEADGTFGFCTIFNSICPEGGPLKTPFLGLTVGKQVWSLSNSGGSFGSFMFSGIQNATEIRYWGHYPVADLEFEMPGSPVSAGLRAWAPFLLGDSATSNTPGAVFEVNLRNLTNEPQEGRVVFSFPGMTMDEASITDHSPRKRIAPYSIGGQGWPAWVPDVREPIHAVRQAVRGEFSGLVVTSDKVKENGYALGVIGDQDVAVGGALSTVQSPAQAGGWAKIGTELPRSTEDDFGGSVAAHYQLKPGEEKCVRFVLAWYAPWWIGEGEHTFMHMYTNRYTSALEVAQFLSRGHVSLLRRILAWQEVIYAEKTYPVWLREGLVNILHLFPINSLWAKARPPIDHWCKPEDGEFGLLDGIVEDPAVEPIPDTFYANAPLVFFFPDAARSSLRTYKAYQFPNGAAVWIWGGVVGWAEGGFDATAGPEMAMPTPGYQTTTNGPCYVDLVDRYLERTGDPKMLQEFYESVKRNTIYTMSLREEDGGDGVISVPRGNVDPMRPHQKEGMMLEWFEFVYFLGMTSHVGGIHLANLLMTQRMAEKMGDTEFARQCKTWFEQGSQSMETKMWTGSYYLNYYEPATERKSDHVFGYQLDGHWMAKFHGLPGVFPEDRVKITLETIKRTCAAISPAGAANMARPDGTLAQGEGYGPNAYFIPEIYMLASTYLYAGDREFGLEMAQRSIYNLAINILSPWNQPNIVRGDNGDRLFGSHYVQNMMLWAVPAALEGKDIAGFCAPGGLVDRMLEVAK